MQKRPTFGAVSFVLKKPIIHAEKNKNFGELYHLGFLHIAPIPIMI